MSFFPKLSNIASRLAFSQQLRRHIRVIDKTSCVVLLANGDSRVATDLSRLAIRKSPKNENEIDIVLSSDVVITAPRIDAAHELLARAISPKRTARRVTYGVAFVIALLFMANVLSGVNSAKVAALSSSGNGASAATIAASQLELSRATQQVPAAPQVATKTTTVPPDIRELLSK
jgi:hypothetical protein